MASRAIRRTCGLILAGLFLAPIHLHAQACTGSPNEAGTATLRGQVDFAENATGYGGSLVANPSGQAFLGGGYRRIDADEGVDANELFALAGIEVEADSDGSVCVFLGGSRAWSGEGINVDGWSATGGLSAGYAAPLGEALYATPHASVAAHHVTTDASIFGAQFGDETSGALIGGGLSLGSRAVWVSGSVAHFTGGGSDTVLAAGFGAAF